jgi:cytochrome c oxidase subunit 4
MSVETHTEEHAHPGGRTYVLVALVLTVITAVEVAIYYIDAIRPLLVPFLLALSAAKFIMVVGFYMHLKYDARLFTGLFGFGLAIGVSVVLAFIALFQADPAHLTNASLVPPKPPSGMPGAGH